MFDLQEFYFPQNVYVAAHDAYLAHSGKPAHEVLAYCMSNTEFFVEVAFSYVEGTPFPEMK